MRRIRTPRARRARPLLVASAISALGAGCSTSGIDPGYFPDDMSRHDVGNPFPPARGEAGPCNAGACPDMTHDIGGNNFFPDMSYDATTPPPDLTVPIISNDMRPDLFGFELPMPNGN